MGLERTFYQVTEDVGVVEVCASVYSPNGNISCPINFTFDVSFSTHDDSAGVLNTENCIHALNISLHSQSAPLIIVLWTLSFLHAG